MKGTRRVCADESNPNEQTTPESDTTDEAQGAQAGPAGPDGPGPSPDEAEELETAAADEDEPGAGAPSGPEGEVPADADAEPDDEESGKPARELPPEALALCRSAIEAMLFSVAEPVSSRRLVDALRDTGADGRVVRKIILELAREYEQARRGFVIEEVAGGFQMLTRKEFADYVSQLQSGGGSARLSQAALETLAVVAYKQPVTRADIEAIRGVQAGPLLRTLLQKGLVRITGRAEVLGRPLLYGTTKKFLEHFGLKSLNELPKVEELPKP